MPLFGEREMGEYKRLDRALDFYFLRTIQKKTIVEIAKEHKISPRTVSRYLKYVRNLHGLTDQQKEDIVFFYENEMRTLMEKREGTSGRIYLQYTDRIIELQEKIAELLALKTLKVEHSGKIEGQETKVIVVFGNGEKNNNSLPASLGTRNIPQE